MRLEEYLFVKKISKTDFAKSLGITRKTLYQYLKGEDMTLSMAKKIVFETKGKVSFLDLLPNITEKK